MQNAPDASSVTCTACGQPARVPFTPTPGRPVYCRDCFSKQRAPSAAGGPAPSPGGARRPPSRFGGGYRSEGRPAPVPGARKRMLAQGRKGHFMFDAREAMKSKEGGMDEQHHRAFLEGLFARGARDSTASAQDFLDEKLADNTITADERRMLGNLIERYSFWR